MNRTIESIITKFYGYNKTKNITEVNQNITNDFMKKYKNKCVIFHNESQWLEFCNECINLGITTQEKIDYQIEYLEKYDSKFLSNKVNMVPKFCLVVYSDTISVHFSELVIRQDKTKQNFELYLYGKEDINEFLNEYCRVSGGHDYIVRASGMSPSHCSRYEVCRCCGYRKSY